MGAKERPEKLRAIGPLVVTEDTHTSRLYLTVK